MNKLLQSLKKPRVWGPLLLVCLMIALMVYAANNDLGSNSYESTQYYKADAWEYSEHQCAHAIDSLRKSEAERWSDARISTNVDIRMALRRKIVGDVEFESLRGTFEARADLVRQSFHHGDLDDCTAVWRGKIKTKQTPSVRAIRVVWAWNGYSNDAEVKTLREIR